MDIWYLLLTKPREEQRVKVNLEILGITAYFPQVEVTRLHRGKPRHRIEPLFPRYLFIQLSDEHPGFSKIRFTPGVTDFVRFNNELAKVNASLIDSLKQREASSEKIELLPEVGDKVTIKEGSFKGVEAIIQAKNGEDRVLLLLQMLNQEAELELSYAEIESA